LVSTALGSCVYGEVRGDFLSSRVPGAGKRDMGDLEKKPLTFCKGRPPKVRLVAWDLEFLDQQADDGLQRDP